MRRIAAAAALLAAISCADARAVDTDEPVVVFVVGAGVEGAGVRGRGFSPDLRYVDASVDSHPSRAGTVVAATIRAAFARATTIPVKAGAIDADVEGWMDRTCRRKYGGGCVVWDLTGRDDGSGALARASSLAEVGAAFRVYGDETPCEAYRKSACDADFRCEWTRSARYGCRVRGFHAYDRRGECDARGLRWIDGGCYPARTR